MITRDDAKGQAKRLRSHLAARDLSLSHAQALEAVAATHGYRDWNTASAKLPERTLPAVGGKVAGTYLRRRFTGEVKSLQTLRPGLWRIAIHFDAPMNVSGSRLFTAERRRIHALIGADGTSQFASGAPDGVLALD